MSASCKIPTDASFGKQVWVPAGHHDALTDARGRFLPFPAEEGSKFPSTVGQWEMAVSGRDSVAGVGILAHDSTAEHQKYRGRFHHVFSHLIDALFLSEYTTP